MNGIQTRVGLALLLAFLAAARPARADATLFMGMTTGTAQPLVGAAWGRWPGPVGFEVELSRTVTSGTAAGGSFGANLLIDTPLRIRRARLYGTAGLGLFARGKSGADAGGPAKNIGGGARIPLADGVNLRVDYRYFRVDSDGGDYHPLHAHRLTTGIAFGF